MFFNHKLLRGNRAIKASSDEFDAFASPSLPALANVGIEIGPRGCPQLLTSNLPLRTCLQRLPGRRFCDRACERFEHTRPCPGTSVSPVAKDSFCEWLNRDSHRSHPSNLSWDLRKLCSGFPERWRRPRCRPAELRRRKRPSTRGTALGFQRGGRSRRCKHHDHLGQV